MSRVFIEDQKKHFGITAKDYARHRAGFPDFLFQQLFPLEIKFPVLARPPERASPKKYLPSHPSTRMKQNETQPT